MKLKVAIVITMSMMLALGLAGIAGAQSVCDTITFENGTAQPGGTETVCGESGAGDSVTVYFDGTEVGSASADEYGDYCVTFSVPTDATVGTHIVEVSILQRETDCEFDYVVEAAAIVPSTEVPVVAATPATLPATGFMLAPAGGLLLGGLGALLFRKRRR